MLRGEPLPVDRESDSAPVMVSEPGGIKAELASDKDLILSRSPAIIASPYCLEVAVASSLSCSEVSGGAGA